MEIDVEKQPSEGEVLIFTVGGGFVVKAALSEATQMCTTEEWPSFELAESGDRIVIRSSQVIAIRDGSKSKHRGHIGFAPGRG